jgi:hypothetical protein
MWLCVVYYWRHVLKRTTFAWASVIAVAAILTNTRSVWIGLVILFVFVLGRRTGSAIVAILAGGAAALLIPLSGLLQQSVSVNSPLWKLLNIFNSSTGTGSYRIDTWNQAINDLSTYGGWGIGLGVNTFPQRHPIDATGVTEGYLSNLWIASVHDSGILGGLALALGVILMFVGCGRRLDAVPLFAALVICATLTNPLAVAIPWVCLALVAGPASSGKDETTIDSHPSNSRFHRQASRAGR